MKIPKLAKQPPYKETVSKENAFIEYIFVFLSISHNWIPDNI